MVMRYENNLVMRYENNCCVFVVDSEAIEVDAGVIQIEEQVAEHLRDNSWM